jgi:hypothetical protein
MSEDFEKKITHASNLISELKTSFCKWKRENIVLEEKRISQHESINKLVRSDSRIKQLFSLSLLRKSEVPVDFSNKIGDILNSLRSSLEYVLYWKSSQHQDFSERDASSIQFPLPTKITSQEVVESNPSFRFLGIKLRQSLCVIVPNPRSEEFNRHQLKLLAELNNPEKHRYLTPTILATDSELRFDQADPVNYLHHNGGGILVHDKPLVLWEYTRSPGIRFNATYETSLIFGEGTSARGLYVIRVLNAIRDYICEKVFPEFTD